MNAPIVHIVRRYGPVGGMESYVWHLTSALAIRDYAVIIVCEQLLCVPMPSIEIIKLESVQDRPRWKSMLFFREGVEHCLRKKFHKLKIIVHSHERSLSHHVTTFHGPPMRMSTFERYIWRGRRISAWRKMEATELLGSNVKMILPVSNQVKNQLIIEYPEIAKKEIKLAWPGVDFPADQPSLRSWHPNKKIRILFVGKEWKRKGLDVAVKIIEKFRLTNECVSLAIKGPEFNQIPIQIRSKDWVIVDGWQKNINWSFYDVLIHPARDEPFGMVVAEARAHGLPVVISTNVGASDVVEKNVWRVSLDSPIEKWMQALEQAVQMEEFSSEVNWSWEDVVRFHIEEVYGRLNDLI